MYPGARRNGLFGQLVVLLLVRLSCAAATNRTIDDTKGDSVSSQRVIYQPSSGGVWNTNSVPCPNCAIRPDPVQAFSGTWTEATYFKQSKDPISATMSFTGTAIWVFFILANNLGPNVITKTMANITLDDQSPELFVHIPNPSSKDLQYNALAFSRTNLENVHHSLVISVSGIQEQVYLNFDYAIYTHEDDDITAIPPPVLPTSLGLTTRQSVVTQTPASQSAVSPTPGTGSSIASSPAGSSTPAPAPAQPSTAIITPNGAENAKSKSPTAAIAGGVVGGVVVALLLAIGLVLLRRRRKQTEHDNSNIINPFGGAKKDPPTSGHQRDPSNGTSITPFPTSPLSTIQISDSTATTDFNDGNRYGGLASISSGATGALTSEKGRMEDLRRARQEELEKRLQETQREMREILDEINSHGAGQPPRRRPLPVPGSPPSTTSESAQQYMHSPVDQMTVDELKETLRQMRAEVDYLQQQQQSAWAQGLSDEPPPGYTAITRALSVGRQRPTQ